MRAPLPSLSLALLLLAGCGGGGTSSVGGAEVESDYGLVSTRSTGAVGAPVLVSAGSLTVLGLAGASFSEARVNFPPMSAMNREEVLARTQLGIMTPTFSAALNYADLSLVIPTMDTDLGDGASTGFAPALAPQGDRMYRVLRPNIDSLDYILEMVTLDGTRRNRLLPESYASSLDLSPDGSTLLFSLNGEGVYKIPTAGGAVEELRRWDSLCRRARWSPDGRTIAFLRDGHPKLMDPDGGNERDFLHPLASPVGARRLDWVDGGRLAMAYGEKIGTAGTGDLGVLPIATIDEDDAYGFSVSPDGGRIAFATHLGSNGGRLMMVPTSGGTPRQVDVGYPVYDVNWGPYIRQKNIIGAGGSLPAGAGFLMGQRGKDVTSYVSFDATTRAGTTVVPGTGSGTANLVFDVRSTDGITQIRFCNELLGRPANPTTGTVAGFLVSFDVASGDVAMVVPYQGGSPTVRSEGGALRVEGDLAGAWDGKGRRVAEPGKRVVL